LDKNIPSDTDAEGIYKRTNDSVTIQTMNINMSLDSC